MREDYDEAGRKMAVNDLRRLFVGKPAKDMAIEAWINGRPSPATFRTPRRWTKDGPILHEDESRAMLAPIYGCPVEWVDEVVAVALRGV